MSYGPSPRSLGKKLASKNKGRIKSGYGKRSGEALRGANSTMKVKPNKKGKRGGGKMYA